MPPCKPGDRIRLLEMPQDPCPIPVGTTGTVLSIVDLSLRQRPEFQIAVKWDIERSLSMIWPLDKFEIIKEEA